jgi:CheY-like chemotaxis protein
VGLVPVIAETCTAAIEQAKAIDHDPREFLGLLLDEQEEGQNSALVAEAIGAASGLTSIKVMVASAEPPRERPAAVDYWIRKPTPTRLAEAINEFISPAMTGAVVSAAPLINSPEVRSLRGATKILAVDDDPVTRTLIAEELEVLGFHTDIVLSGQEALEFLERERCGIILMDVSMPQIDGYQAAAEIRRREKSGHRAIIIAFSAYPTEAIRRRSEEAGIDDCLAKTAPLAELASVLDSWAQRAWRPRRRWLGPTAISRRYARLRHE